MYFHMGKSRRQAVTLLAMLLAFCGCAFALDPSLDISQYAHSSWKVRDGFVKGQIFAIAQTPDGYLWLGTEFGLSRFDGVRAVPWQPGAGQRLPSDFIRALLVSSDGSLWIGTQNGLSSWKDGKLKTYPEVGGDSILSLFEDREATVWVGTGPGNSTPHAKLCAYSSGGVHCEGGDGLFGRAILKLYEDSAGNLWLGVQNGFWRWKPGESAFFDMRADLSGFAGFLEDNQKELLIGTSAGLDRLVNGRIEPYTLPEVPKALKVTRMLRDDDSVWIGTADQGLLHIGEGKKDTFSQADGLSGDLVADLFEDREGDIWVATENGLDRFRKYPVTNISIRQGLSSDIVNSVLASKDGSIWISTSNGLNRWKDGQVSLLASRSGDPNRDGKLNSLPPRTLFQESSGRIWVSTNREFGYLQNEKFVAIRELPSFVVGDIVETSGGHIWIRHHDAGLLHLFDGKIVQQIPWAGLGHDNDPALSLVADPSQKGLWLGFVNGGVAYFEDGGVRKSYSAADGLGRGMVDGLRFGARGGTLWAATEGGLSRIKDDHILTLTSKNGLPCDAVHWSIEDEDHSMWLNMHCGLVRIERSELDAWVVNPTRAVKMNVFGITDGVLSRVGPIADRPPVIISIDGKIWFAGIGGVSVIDPHNLHENKLPPPVHIENITADDKPVEVSNGIHLPTGVRHLDIDYTALSLVVPEKVRFRVKLEGEDKDWRELVNVRHVEYTNLPPKHYRFRVLACNNSGVWNEEGASLDFVIPPAWYQTNWFRAACVAAFLALLWAAYQLRVRQLAYQFNMRLEERVAERTRVARDLHDTLLQSFQALLPSLQAGINLLATRPADARKVLEATADHASQAIAEGRDAVQGLRMSTVEKNDLAIAIRTVGEELASAASSEPSPNFNVVVEGASRNLHPILRDEVYRLATEALRNAFRHAAAQNIEVEIRYDEKYFRLRVRDDGKGIPSDVLSGDGREGHYGLPGMRERAKLLGGKLAIWTELDGGTEIELNIPGARAYVKSTRTFWHFGKGSATDTDEKEPIERE